MHINEDHFYPEIIDPESGQHLPDGQFGELVLTSLTREALPCRFGPAVHAGSLSLAPIWAART